MTPRSPRSRWVYALVALLVSAAPGADWLADMDRGVGVAREGHFEAALEHLDRALGNAPADAAAIDVGLLYQMRASLHGLVGNPERAESDFEQAIRYLESGHGPGHPETATALTGLMMQYLDQGRAAEARPLFDRGFDAYEAGIDGGNMQYIEPLMRHVAAYVEGVPEFMALATIERVVGLMEGLASRIPDRDGFDGLLETLRGFVSNPDDDTEAALRQSILFLVDNAPDLEAPGIKAILADNRRKLGNVLRDKGRFDEAMAEYRLALEAQRELGHSAIFGANTLESIANLEHARGDLDGARRTRLEFETTLIQVVGERVPRLAESAAIRARWALDAGDVGQALADARAATAILVERFDRLQGDTEIGRADRVNRAGVFATHLDVVAAAGGDRALRDEAYRVMQVAVTSSAAGAISGMAARFAARDDGLGRAVRERQQSADHVRELEQRLRDAIGRPVEQRDAVAEDRIRERLLDEERQLRIRDARIAEDFPEYTELVDPRPLTLDETGALLNDDEAMLVLFSGDDRSHLLAVRGSDSTMLTVELPRHRIETLVARIRLHLDPSNINNMEELLAFPLELAAEVYSLLFADAAAFLDPATTWYVVPSGPLQSLPISSLPVSNVPEFVENFEQFREVEWLGERVAPVYLPSPGALNALRRFAGRSSAPEPFIGFGDPLLDGDPGAGRGAIAFTRGALADVDSVRRLPRLPETRAELEAVAASLGAPGSSVRTGFSAAEPEVRDAPLADYRVVAFATHGLMAGEFDGVAEPALVLTPPVSASEHDDGLLTAAEVAQLELDADWVILSACNTAAADGTPGAEGLSGLARAFFHAGSRALLVSQWAVSSEATVALVTRMIDYWQAGASRADALRLAAVDLMHDDARPEFAHPLFWAPFVVAGDGR